MRASWDASQSVPGVRQRMWVKVGVGRWDPCACQKRWVRVDVGVWIPGSENKQRVHVSLESHEMWATARWGASWVEKGLETETGGGRFDRATKCHAKACGLSGVEAS